jgi:hypothetical protein
MNICTCAVLIKHYNMKAFREWKYSSTVLDLGTRWMLMVSYTSASILPWKVAPITLWTGGWVGPLVALDAMEKRKYLPLQGVKSLPSNS